MAKRIIAKDGDESLRKRCKDVTVFDDKLWTMLDDMYETMQEANGVGLAAPQISVLRRVVVIDVGDEHGKIELINPVITSMKGKQHELEGCLSVPRCNQLSASCRSCDYSHLISFPLSIKNSL